MQCKGRNKNLLDSISWGNMHYFGILFRLLPEIRMNKFAYPLFEIQFVRHQKDYSKNTTSYIKISEIWDGEMVIFVKNSDDQFWVGYSRFQWFVDFDSFLSHHTFPPSLSFLEKEKWSKLSNNLYHFRNRANAAV